MPTNLRIRSCLTLALVCCGALAVAGCGPSRVNVKGTLVPPPNLQLKDDDSVTISFVPEDKNAGLGAGPAVWNAADKSFVAKASDAKGLPPGKYKIAVQIQPYTAADTDPRANDLSVINDAYASDKTKLSYEVTSDANQTVTIDLTSGTVTKK